MAVWINKMMQKFDVSNSEPFNIIQISYLKHAAPSQVRFALEKLWESGLKRWIFYISLKLSY